MRSAAQCFCAAVCSGRALLHELPLHCLQNPRRSTSVIWSGKPLSQVLCQDTPLNRVFGWNGLPEHFLGFHASISRSQPWRKRHRNDRERWTVLFLLLGLWLGPVLPEQRPLCNVAIARTRIACKIQQESSIPARKKYACY